MTEKYSIKPNIQWYSSLGEFEHISFCVEGTKLRLYYIDLDSLCKIIETLLVLEIKWLFDEFSTAYLPLYSDWYKS